jgi:hypothetical protein
MFDLFMMQFRIRSLDRKPDCFAIGLFLHKQIVRIGYHAATLKA